MTKAVWDNFRFELNTNQINVKSVISVNDIIGDEVRIIVYSAVSQMEVQIKQIIRKHYE